jgi:hypothetical protein
MEAVAVPVTAVESVIVTDAMMASAVVAAAAVAAFRHRIRWERQRGCHCGDVS